MFLTLFVASCGSTSPSPATGAACNGGGDSGMVDCPEITCTCADGTTETAAVPAVWARVRNQIECQCRTCLLRAHRQAVLFGSGTIAKNAHTIAGADLEGLQVEHGRGALPHALGPEPFRLRRLPSPPR